MKILILVLTFFAASSAFAGEKSCGSVDSIATVMQDEPNAADNGSVSIVSLSDCDDGGTAELTLKTGVANRTKAHNNSMLNSLRAMMLSTKSGITARATFTTAYDGKNYLRSLSISKNRD